MAALTDSDRKFVERAWTDQEFGDFLRRSLAFDMAQKRLAAQGIFWQQSTNQFVTVS